MIQANEKAYTSGNIYLATELPKALDELRVQGKKIGLCTGSFDLLHPGHITHLVAAKKQCDILVVEVSNDIFAGRKGGGRPIIPEQLRAYMVAQLKVVDYVFIGDGSRKAYDVVKPHFLFKGKDFAQPGNKDMIEAKEFLKSYDTEIRFTEDEKLATTDIIKYIHQNVSLRK